MDLDDELESIEQTGQTDTEWTDEDLEIQDYNNDLDEVLGPDADEGDLERAYKNFETKSESDYNGRTNDKIDEATLEDSLESGGFHIEDETDLKSEEIEMEIEDDDIYAVIVDEDDNEIGFILLDEDGNEQEYYYVADDDADDENSEHGVQVVRASDDEEFDLGITREGVAEATADMNAIYRDGAAVVAELKGAFDDISEGLSFLKKR